MAPGLPRNCVGPRPLDCGACRTWRHHAALRAGPAYRGRSVCAKSIRLEPSGLILPKALNRVADIAVLLFFFGILGCLDVYRNHAAGTGAPLSIFAWLA